MTECFANAPLSSPRVLTGQSRGPSRLTPLFRTPRTDLFAPEATNHKRSPPPPPFNTTTLLHPPGGFPAACLRTSVPPASPHGAYNMLPVRLCHSDHVEPVDILRLFLTKALSQTMAENTNSYAAKQLEERKQSGGRK